MVPIGLRSAGVLAMLWLAVAGHCGAAAWEGYDGPDGTRILETDPAEAYDLADRHPALVAELSEKARAWEQEMKPYYRKECERR
jgi:hypothetical protein